MNNLDKQILEGLVAGRTANEIADYLGVPLHWVTEFKAEPVERVVDDRLSGQTLDGMN